MLYWYKGTNTDGVRAASQVEHAEHAAAAAAADARRQYLYFCTSKANKLRRTTSQVEHAEHAAAAADARRPSAHAVEEEEGLDKLRMHLGTQSTCFTAALLVQKYEC